MKSPNYANNTGYYKKLIYKINDGSNFPMYLHQNGFKMIRKSSGSMEFQKDGDRIVLQTSRSPMTYFNRNDSLDKGLFFKYLLQRNPNFYNAVQLGLEITDRIYDMGNTAIKIDRPKTNKKSLEENYNIVPLRNPDYLKIQRGISDSTINSIPFRGRILNAYHLRDNGGKIANIAFPKYDLEDTPKNYILYNRPYKRRADNALKKFRLVLNQKDHYLFYSRVIDNPANIVFGESGIDLLSYHELHGRDDNFYISFGGNVYKEKMEFFIQLIRPSLKSKNVNLISIMDNDIKGHEFDLKIFIGLINHYNANIHVESSFRMDTVGLNIHYSDKVRNMIAPHSKLMKERLDPVLRQNELPLDLVQCVGFSDKIHLEFSLKDIINTNPIQQNSSVFKTLTNTFNALYLPFPIAIHKSSGKDWNDDLRVLKKPKYLRMEPVLKSELAIGDKIELKTEKGPEGASNEGIIKSIRPNSIECDFGLRHTYAIPLRAIRSHLKKNTYPRIQEKAENLKKNNNLQNHQL